MKREEGYYWVKYEGKWRIGKYSPGDEMFIESWDLVGSFELFKDSDFEEIDEEIIVGLRDGEKHLFSMNYN